MDDEQLGGGRARWLRALVPIGLGLVMLWSITATYPEFNATFDEPYHIAAGLQAYQEARFSVGAEQPPLARWLIAWLPHRFGIEYRGVVHRSAGFEDELFHLSRSVMEEQGEYWTTLARARAGVLLFVPVMIFFVYRWSSELHGVWAGWGACALVAFSPNLMAHAGLATTDFAVAALLTASAYAAWRWAREPSRRRAAFTGCLSGLAIGSKYSAVGFLAVILAGVFVLTHGKTWLRRSSWKPAAVRAGGGQALLFGVLAFLSLWACFGFETRPLRDPQRRPYETLDRILPPVSSLSAALYWAAENVPVPLQDFAIGVSWVAGHARQGHPAFLLGEVASHGWWHYFPVVLAVKTTGPFLLLIAGAGVLLCRQRGGAPAGLVPLVAAGGVLLVSMSTPINIGVRHILPIYPLLAVGASAWFRPGGSSGRAYRLRMVLGIALLVWHVGESWHAHPDYLAYFNSLARGREHQVLGDSNLDWGQDLRRLSRHVQAQRIEKLSLRYFGTTSPEAVGLRNSTAFGPRDRPRGWVASSVTYLQGLYEPKSPWLEGRKPHAKIGKSIWLFHID